MKLPIGEGLIAQIVGFAVAAVCIAAVIVLSVRLKRRTGQYPREIMGGPSEVGWFALFWFTWWVWRTEFLSKWLGSLPLLILVLGIDLALLVAFVALAAHAFAWVFRPDWHWRWGLYIAFRLAFLAMAVGLVLMDARRAGDATWIWILAAIIAAFLSPFCARWAYEEFDLRKAPSGTRWVGRA
jgi:hypothetical protein